MSTAKPILSQKIMEVRYERGYRYLDRCGDVMVILEEALPEVSNGCLWMPDQATPTEARIKCPELDLTVVFNTNRLAVDQYPVEADCDLIKICEYIFNTIVSKFEIKTINRFGQRQVYVIGTDSIQKADSLTLKMIPINDWPVKELNGLTIKSKDVRFDFSNEDDTKGSHFSVKPFLKREAPITIDERLNSPPHLLKANQREVLLDQLKRQKKRETDPVAGILADIDYWWLNPKNLNLSAFAADGQDTISKILGKFVGM